MLRPLCFLRGCRTESAALCDRCGAWTYSGGSDEEGPLWIDGPPHWWVRLVEWFVGWRHIRCYQCGKKLSARQRDEPAGAACFCSQACEDEWMPF